MPITDPTRMKVAKAKMPASPIPVPLVDVQQSTIPGLVNAIDWGDLPTVLSLMVAADWSKPFAARVAQQKFYKRIVEEAALATIEAVTRKLRSRGWQRRYSSPRRGDGHVDSRYYRPPDHHGYEARISTHVHPNLYQGVQYIITAEVMANYNALGLVRLIERDWQSHRSRR